MNDEAVVLSEREGSIAILTLNRPSVHNALSSESRRQLHEALSAADCDKSVRVVVITGAGRSFCSGRDLAEASSGAGIYDDRAAEFGSFNRKSIGKPTIAAVQGYALGGGFELALACDLIIAAKGAQFALPEVHRNMVATGGGLLRLARRLPHNVAVEMALTGARKTAEDLDRWGLFASVVEADELRTATLELAGQIVRGGPSAVRATKETLRMASVWGDSDVAFDAQSAIVAWAHTSPDREEGVQAFLEKREPVWADL